MRRVLSKLNASNANTIIVLISQVRDTLNQPAAGFSPVGGHGLRHYAHVWLDFKIRGRVTVEVGDARQTTKQHIGIMVSVTSLKNKTAPPFRTAEFVLILHPYKTITPPALDPYYDVFVWGERLGVITHKGAWYDVVGWNWKWHGREGFYTQPLEKVLALQKALRDIVLNYSPTKTQPVAAASVGVNENNGGE